MKIVLQYSKLCYRHISGIPLLRLLSLIFLNTHGEVHVNLEKEIITVKEDQSLSYEMAENPDSKSKQSEDINPMSNCFK